jgi:acetolactate synthase small subunit
MPTVHLRLSVRSNPDVLHRVVSVCRRRTLEIESMRYDRGRIALAVVGRDDQTRHIRRWLLGLVDVLAVVDVPGIATPGVHIPDVVDAPGLHLPDIVDASR